MDRLNDPNHVREPVAGNVRDVSDALSRLVRDHIELAKAELAANVKKVAFDGSMTGAGAALLALGWVLLMFSAAYGLGTIIGNGYAFLVVAGTHLLLGFALVGVFGSRLKNQDRIAPEKTQGELSRDRQFLNRVRSLVRENRQLPA